MGLSTKAGAPASALGSYRSYRASGPFQQPREERGDGVPRSLNCWGWSPLRGVGYPQALLGSSAEGISSGATVTESDTSC